ncbi:MAG: hypothetical protein PHD06_04365 [Bacteroidales bacterium]|jgi:hypothetical protein|nr:hypothetical protein [Bacteroidales bacterium]MDY0197763.1 hypothetical protein [Tenuifilaceae bacterium]
MKPRSLKLLCIAAVIVTSCHNYSPVQESIKATFDKEVQLKMFKTVVKQGEDIPLNEILDKYRYISLVYLRQDCEPCYEKYIDWHEKMDSIGIWENYTILFVIVGRNFDEFISEVNLISDVDEFLYTVMDKNNIFLDTNNHIPEWIFDLSVIIDHNKKIKMIGAPFHSEELTKQYNNLCKHAI